MEDADEVLGRRELDYQDIADRLTVLREEGVPYTDEEIKDAKADLERQVDPNAEGLKDFLARGIDALYPRRSGPPPDAARRRRVAHELRRLLAEDRTWTSRQLSEALATRGIALGPRQVRRHLKWMKAGYRRTASTLKHKQDPEEVERASILLKEAMEGADDLGPLGVKLAAEVRTGDSWLATK